jgi:hypothetical protein
MTATTVLLAGLLAGCGGGTDAYCESLESASDEFSTFEGGNAGDLEQAMETFDELADEAPGDVQADWEVLDEAFSGLEDALEEAGLEFSDLDSMMAGETPENIDPTKLAALAEDLQALATDDIQKAADNIEKHAKDECGIDLSES